MSYSTRSPGLQSYIDSVDRCLDRHHSAGLTLEDTSYPMRQVELAFADTIPPRDVATFAFKHLKEMR